MNNIEDDKTDEILKEKTGDNMLEQQWKQRLELLKTWLVEAGERQIERMNEGLQVEQKSAANDLVTEMDLWTDEFLQAKIKESFPDDSIYSEEIGQLQGQSGYEWVIDPIDGTTNYAHGFSMFCISVAINYEGETVIGVVLAPQLQQCYEAVRGQGAFLNGKKLSVSSIDSMPKAIVATGFPYDKATHPENNVKQFNAVILKVGDIRRTGSAALDLCHVAGGHFDAYWEYKINRWDFEAGLLIVEEAGGKVAKKKLSRGYLVVAGNEVILDGLLELIKE
ncbi:inositol monophosphatase family protein [Alkalihalobacillus sp. LMS39]|uniref:inositol monophosphatase family protein n=1 Tax=Alkalihalobacillus sp. LMS39 TaxID=2924032 RepID=UPI001FB3E7FB|nr:inositol monophosphatase family protein [Alkalihalobacillus sp. LMS39]UOE94866.1 inositol monophosphatase [Alkalihalobacillus sp. LMS39]